MVGEWKECTLGDVLELQRGFDLPTQERLNGAYPIIASTGIVGFHSEAMVKAPGVVIGRSGSLGGGQYVTHDFWPLNTTLWVKDFKGNDVRFCFYLLKSIDFNNFNVGGAVPTLNRNHVHPLPIRVPYDIPEQRAIAHILGTLDDKIELNRKQNETLEEMARTIFRAWFVDFAPVRAKMDGRWRRGESLPGLPAHLYDLFPDRLVESELGEIPEGWEVSSLSKTCSYINRGISPKYTDSSGVLVLNQKCIRNFSIDFSKARRHDDTQKKINERTIELGDVLVNSTGVGTLGRVAQVRRLTERTIVDSHVTVVRPGSRINSMYLGSFMSMKQPEIEAMGSGSTGQTELSRTMLGALKILLPTDEILDQFSKHATMWSKTIAVNQETSDSLAQLRDTLLPKLISGELRVGDVEHIVGAAV